MWLRRMRALRRSTNAVRWRLHKDGLTQSRYNNIVVSMIPTLVDVLGALWPVWPEGMHTADFAAVATRFAINPWRQCPFEGLLEASRILSNAGCRRPYLNGSFVTGKPKPADYDACWEPDRVNPDLLDPTLLNFDNHRALQKAKYKGEFFPASASAGRSGATFVDFFQIEKFTGLKKGIILVELSDDPMMKVEESP